MDSDLEECELSVFSAGPPLIHTQVTDEKTHAMAPTEELMELRKQLEIEIRQHQVHHAVVSRTLNSRLPVSRLPDELIVKAIRSYQESSLHVTTSHINQAKFDRSTWWWLVPSHVCHRWRMVTLSNSLLWCYIDDSVLSKHDLLHLALHRSCQSPLDISVIQKKTAGLHIFDWSRAHIKEEEESLRRVFEESHRIRTLRLQMDPTVIESQLSNSNNLAPFSILQDLDIAVPFSFKGGTFALSPIFRSPLSNLRSLRLEGTHIPWEMIENLPMTLATLHLEFIYGNPGKTAEDILSLVERFQQLKYLCLVNVPVNRRARTSEKTICLPLLKELILSHENTLNPLVIMRGLNLRPGMTKVSLKIPMSPTVVLPVSFQSIFSKFDSSHLSYDTDPQHLMEADVSFCAKGNSETLSSLVFRTTAAHAVGAWPLHFKFSLFYDDEMEDWQPDSPISVDFLQAASQAVCPWLGSLMYIGSYTPFSP